MTNQDNIWRSRQHVFDKYFPFAIVFLVVVGLCLTYLTVKTQPSAEAGDNADNAIIRNQLAVLDQHGTRDTSADPTRTVSAKTNQGPINLRTATPTELETLKGIGEKRAADIAVLRDEGQIKSVEDLQKVKGIGQKLFSEIKNELIWE